MLNSPLRFVDPTGTTCQNSQVDNGDGTFTDSVVDDGDGQGCAVADVSATQNGLPPSDASDIGAQQVDVQEQQTSLADYLWTTLTNTIPVYVENDEPLNPTARAVFTHPTLQKSVVVMTNPCTYAGWTAAAATAGTVGVVAANSAEATALVKNNYVTWGYQLGKVLAKAGSPLAAKPTLVGTLGMMAKAAPGTASKVCNGF